MWTYNYSPELYHHGILGQKWGVRRYQNPDGTLTEAGKKRLNKASTRISKFYDKDSEKSKRDRDKYLKKGQYGKASVMDENIRRNEMKKNERLRYLNSMNYDQFMQIKKQDRSDLIGQRFEIGDSFLTSKLSLKIADIKHQGRRFTTKMMQDSEVRDMTPEQAYEYVYYREMDAANNWQTNYSSNYRDEIIKSRHEKVNNGKS